MIIERTQSEILVRLPLETKILELQDMLNFLKYKEIVSSSKAKDSEIEELTKLINNEINGAISDRIRH